jgi:hypothetical protein
MLKSLSLVTVGATVMALGAITQAEATQIIQPQSASTNMGEDFPLVHSIDQSGLSVGYTTGVTDFDTYLSGNPTHTSAPGTDWVSFDTTGSVTFDFGNVLNLQGMALWNFSADPSFGVSDFELFASSTGNAGSFMSLGSFNANAQSQPSSAQVFNFNPTAAQFIRMDILSHYGASSTGIGEVAFKTADVTPEPVPEPMTVFGAATALGFGALVNRKNAKKHKNKDNN